MSKGDRMLKKLGYEDATDKYIVKENCLVYKNEDGYGIYFSLADKGVAIYGEDMRYQTNKMAMLNMDELKAIKRKCKELGFFRKWRLKKR